MIDIKRFIVPAMLAAVVMTAVVPPADAQTYYRRDYVVVDNIPVSQARRAALRVHSGTVTHHELIRGRGGQDIYVFHIRNPGGRYAVAIDAETGVVLDNVREGRTRVYKSNFWDRLFAPTKIGP